MIIQYWSDFSCPFCYIAEARLMKAMDEEETMDMTGSVCGPDGCR